LCRTPCATGNRGDPAWRQKGTLYVKDRSVEHIKATRHPEDDSGARVDLSNEIVAYIDRPNSLLFLEEGIVRFEATNVVVHTRSQGEADREHMGPLSVTFARGGRRICTVDGRRMAIDEDSYLISNLGQNFSGTPEYDANTETFLVGFWPGFAEEILRTLVTPADRLLDDLKLARFQPVEFVPQIYSQDDLVTPVLDQLQCATQRGGVTRGWLEEWNHRLLHRLLLAHRKVAHDIEAFPGAKASTRAEYYTRLNRARDFMESHLEEALDLRGISSEAWLSPHHFLRLFKQVYNETPHQYLTRRRIERARRLLLRTDMPVTDICYAVGFESLGSFSWLFRKRVGLSPEQYRKESRPPRIIR
jgi:AraC-like DNA-binding protein